MINHRMCRCFYLRNKILFSFVLSRIPCAIPATSRQSCRDTINNMHQIYKFLGSQNETCILLARFRLWPLIFIPRTKDIGDFVFAHEVFWQDSELLLTTNNTIMSESTQRIAIQLYYGNDVAFQRFFIELLQVKQGPTLDDYLPLLSNVADKSIEYLWKCIKVITRVAFIQNEQTIVKGIREN